MNTMTAKAITADLFDARLWAGKFEGYSDEDILRWTMDMMAQLMDGDLVPVDVYLEIEALED